MTEISIKHQDDVYEMDIKGHAGYGENGTDIVCAAISTLTYTLINCLENLKERERVDEFSYIERDGRILITFEGDSTELLSTLATIRIGFLMLEENFPEFISISGEKTEK